MGTSDATDGRTAPTFGIAVDESGGNPATGRQPDSSDSSDLSGSADARDGRPELPSTDSTARLLEDPVIGTKDRATDLPARLDLPGAEVAVSDAPVDEVNVMTPKASSLSSGYVSGDKVSGDDVASRNSLAASDRSACSRSAPSTERSASRFWGTPRPSSDE